MLTVRSGAKAPLARPPARHRKHAFQRITGESWSLTMEETRPTKLTSKMEGWAIDMVKTDLQLAEDEINFLVNWNNKNGASESSHLSPSMAIALVRELADLRKKVADNMQEIEDILNPPSEWF